MAKVLKCLGIAACLLCFGMSLWAEQTQPLLQNLFFVLHANSGTLVAQGDAGHHYILTLNQVPPDITYFSDKPRHLVGSLLLNTVTIAASKRLDAGFAGALSFRNAAKPGAGLMTTLIEVNHYVFLSRKDQVVLQVVLENPHLRGSHYALRDILLHTDGMWYVPYLFGRS